MVFFFVTTILGAVLVLLMLWVFLARQQIAILIVLELGSRFHLVDEFYSYSATWTNTRPFSHIC